MSVDDQVEKPTLLSELDAVSPVDGRYAHLTAPLRGVCSEMALMRYRIQVEVEWLKTLAREPNIVGLNTFKAEENAALDEIATGFDISEAQRIKTIETMAKHDVKAVEYYLREKLNDQPALKPAIPFIHFACTSEDINNLAYGLMLSDARETIIVPALRKIVDNLQTLSVTFAGKAMLSRTHGQTASPTTMGKELAVFTARLRRQIEAFSKIDLLGKMNGAVGNYNAHVAAYASVEWPDLGKQFVQSLGLEWNAYTTQIEPHDWIAEYADTLARINTVLTDLCGDIWSYISIGYFTQKKIDGEVGSSTMPHKVNPIDFENAEGNLGIANALLQYFSRKLPISRLQRDLTDSTVLRNVGNALGHTLIACHSLRGGLTKLELDDATLVRDLDSAWEVLAEPIHTVMRCYGIIDSYEQLKELTRGRTIDRVTLVNFIDQLELPADVKATLKTLTPKTYIGLAEKLAKDI